MKYDNFFVFEGLDKAGKSTFIKKIEENLLKEGLSVAVLHFPTDIKKNSQNIFGNLVQDFLNNKINPKQPEMIYQLYANDRLEQKYKLKFLLKNHDVVLCDRYMYSNLAYMGVKMGKEMESMVNYGFQLEFDIYQIPEPHKVFFLNTKEDILNARYNREKETADVLEKDRALQKKARVNYLKLAEIIPNYQIVTVQDNNKILSIIKNSINIKGEI